MKKTVFGLFILLVFCSLFGYTSYSALDATRRIPCNRQQDSLELVKLYQHTNGDAWTVKWDLSKSMDTWFGLSLNKGGCVQCLDLDGDPNCSWNKKQGNNLVGELPELNLPHLEHLFLKVNKLSGKIPSFEKTTNLLTLQLSSNKLSGEIPDFTHLSKLISLELDYNQFTGSIPNFSNLKKLQSLYLDYNQLSGSIPNFYLPELRFFFCRHNKLTGALPNFKFAEKLRRVLLQGNQLTASLPPLQHLQQLENLHLAENSLTGCIPSFEGMSALRSVNLSQNNFSCVTNAPINSTTKIFLENNQLSFKDLTTYQSNFSASAQYLGQTWNVKDSLFYVEKHQDLWIELPLKDALSTNIYEWYFEEELISKVEGDPHLLIEDFKEEQAGTYYCLIRNNAFTDLVIQSPIYIVRTPIETANAPAITTEKIAVETEEEEFYVSGLLAPNGDGRFSRFVISILDKHPEKYPQNELKVFTQQGQLVYQKKGYCNNWQGSYRGTGEMLPAGIYVWSIQLDEKTAKSGLLVIQP